MKRNGKLALCGITTALCVVCMFLTSIFPYATYALPALAGLLLTFIVIECGKRWAIAVYAATALLSLFLTPDIEAKVMFIAFLGYYPVLKAIYESLRRPYFAWLLKFCTFNGSVILAYFVTVSLLKIVPNEFELFGVNLPLLFLLLGNVVFLLYDIGMTQLIQMYIQRFCPRIKKIFHT